VILNLSDYHIQVASALIDQMAGSCFSIL